MGAGFDPPDLSLRSPTLRVTEPPRSPSAGVHYNNGSVRDSPNGTICTIGIAIGTNGITNGAIGKTLNDIGIPLVPLGNPNARYL